MRFIMILGLLHLMLHAAFVKEGAVVKETESALFWQDSEAVESTSMLYAEAVTYCQALVIEEKEDWRLPTLIELQTLIDYNRYDPALQRGFHFGLSKVYWSVSPYANDKDRAWHIDFKSGVSDHSRHSYDYNVRCVRSVK